MQQVGELLPVGSIVLLKGGTKKTMIMGVLQTDEEHPETVYDYMGIPELCQVHRGEMQIWERIEKHRGKMA